MAPLHISVVLCGYTSERWDDLRAAVESVRQQTLPPDEIILVIDHNPALYARACAELPDVIVMENQEPKGVSGARNTGVAAARGEILAFLDDDAVAADDWLETLAAGYNDPSVIGIGGAIEPYWQTGRPSWFPTEFDWVVGCTYTGMPEVKMAVRNLIGANMSCLREAFERVGGFRSEMGRVHKVPIGCEETEWCIRVRQNYPGRQFIYEPRARVRHHVPPRRSQWRYFRARCYSEGISKALVSSFVGAGDGLAAERTYTLRTLPSGVVRGLADTGLRGDPSGAARAGAIVAGLTLTTFGYLVGVASRLLTSSSSTPSSLTPSSSK